MNAFRKPRAQLLAGALATLAFPAWGQAGVSVLAGYATGGSFEEVRTGANVDVANSPAFALALDLPYDASRQWQVFFAQQASDFELAPGSGTRADLTLRYLQLGGTVHFSGRAGEGAYLAGGLGATWFSPSAPGYESGLRPSMSLALGYALPLGTQIALRAEVRGYATFINSSGGFLCSGGCIAVLKADAFTQAQALLGLSARF
ncbi:MAG TPA: hypothetical protein PK326_04675 [Burkholderiaceae bacterium]|nr:hypothetical protein [Burkholderiaceae bacterium]